MLYFSYGSNMSSRRLAHRVPSARFVAVATLPGHDLRFHKAGRDGSAKCDAFATGNPQHTVIGVVYRMRAVEKPLLDAAEGLGVGYLQKQVTLTSRSGRIIKAMTYCATQLDPALRPFHWYKQHVLNGAREFALPPIYVQRIAAIRSEADPQRDRQVRELAIYSPAYPMMQHRQHTG